MAVELGQVVGMAARGLSTRLKGCSGTAGEAETERWVPPALLSERTVEDGMLWGGG